MAIRDTLPLSKNDSVIVLGDTGKSIEKIQSALQSLPSIQEQQDLLGGIDRDFSLLDPKRFGIYEKDTRLFVISFQDENKERIKKVGNLSEEEFIRERGSIGFSTWYVLSRLSSEQNIVPQKPRELKEETREPIPDPPLAKKNLKATHYVKTTNIAHRLALRSAPAYIKVSEEANKDNDKKGKLIAMMPNSTLLKVVEPHVGFECQWHKVEVVDDSISVENNNSLYVFSKFIQPLNTTPHMLPIKCCFEKPSLEKSFFPNWIELDECEPFYDESTCSYYIVVGIGETSSDEIRIKKQREIAKEVATNKILEFYNKQRDIQTINNLLTAFKFCEIGEEDWFLDERPGSEIKFLVKFPAKYFDAIPESTENLLDTVHIESNLPQGWRTIHFPINSFEEKIKVVSTRFDEYALDIEKWNGNLVDFDIKQESERLRSFYPLLKKFLLWNNVDDLTKTIEIGFEGPCLNLKYILLNENDISYPLRIGLECFKKMKPIFFQRTMGYIFYLDEMYKEINTFPKKPWIEFVQNYSCPIPQIRLSNNENGAVREFNLIKTTREKELEDESIDREYKEIIYNKRKNERDVVDDITISCENIVSLLDKVQTIEDVYNEVLNKVDISQISSIVSSCIASTSDSEQMNEIVCDLILDRLSFEQLNDLLDLLEQDVALNIRNHFLNIGDSSISGVSVDSNEAKLRTSIKNNLSREQICQAINQLDSSLINNLIEKFTLGLDSTISQISKIPTLVLPDNFPTTDIMSNVGKGIVDVILQMLSSLLISLVKSLLRDLCDKCSEANDDEKYGDQNINNFVDDNVLQDIFSNFSDTNLNKFDNENENIQQVEQNSTLLMMNFLDDLSAMLLPTEICELISGEPKEDILKIIEKLINAKYVSLKNKFYDIGIIRMFFKEIGKRTRLNCEELGNRVRKVNKKFCELDALTEFRKEVLKDRLSQSQIDKQIKKIKEIEKEKIKMIFKFSERENINKILSDLTGDFCDSTMSSIPKINPVNVEHESVKILNDRVTNTIFDGINMSFNNDLMGFVYTLIGTLQDNFNIDSFNINKEQYKQSYDAKLKKVDEITSKDTEALMSDPDSTGLEKTMTNIIAPIIKDLFSNENNFISTVNEFNDGSRVVRISFKTDIPKIEDKLNELRDLSLKSNEQVQKKFDNLTISIKEGELRQQDFFTDERVIDTISFMNTLGKKECEDKMPTMISSEQSMQFITLINLLSMTRNSLIELEFNVFDNQEVRDTYKIFVKDSDRAEDFIIEVKDEIKDKQIRQTIDNLIKIKSDSSIRQVTFANFILNIWNNVLDEESVKKINDPNSDFFIYFRDNVYSIIIDKYIDNITKQISMSKLFYRNNLEKINFIPDDNLSLCSFTNQNGLLDILKIKENTSIKYEKNLSNCSHMRYGQNAFESSIEDSIIEILLKVSVIEYFLRSIFSFSEFGIQNILKDNVIEKYIVYRIRRDLKDFGENYYIQFLLKCKQILEKNGDKIIEEGQDIQSEEVEEERDLLHPDYQSGEFAFQILLKRQIKEISQQFDLLLGTNINNINEILLQNDWIFNTSTQTAGELINHISDNAPKGELVLEKYIRVCKNGKKRVEIIKGDLKDVNFSYGIRLNYRMPNDLSFMKELKMKNQNLSSEERTYIFPESSVALSIEGIKRKPNNSYSFPIIVAEEEEVRNIRLDSVKEEQIFNNLKEKIKKTNEYKLLYEFVFPISKLISISSIYNIESMTTSIDGFRNIFANTKKLIRSIGNSISQNELWWNNPDPEIEGRGGNMGILQERMNNITTKGPNINLSKIAALTVPMIIKGLAERFDPSYKLIKTLDSAGAAPAGLTWGSVPSVAPINIFGPFGFGPPLGPYGALALSVPSLPGEVREKREKDAKKEFDEGKKCEGN